MDHEYEISEDSFCGHTDELANICMVVFDAFENRLVISLIMSRIAC